MLIVSLDDLPAPRRTFASDNSAGVHPEVLAALEEANTGHVLAYGNDEHTRRCEQAFNDLFGRDVGTYLVWGGSGGNVLALTSLWRPGGAVICTESAHIHVDETASPERVVGIKLLTVPHEDGKLLPEHLERQVPFLGVQHHPQACAVSITQASELGTVYSPEEVAAICETAHRLGMKVHLDGARIANATATLGSSLRALRSFTVDAGVDIVTFGGTKNGMMYGEAVVYLDAELERHAIYARKQVGQLPSKMRFVAAQFTASLDSNLWLSLAGHANEMAARLYSAVADLPEVQCAPPQANSLYPVLPRAAAEQLQQWCPFYEWDHARSQYRWMTAWDTTEEDVDRFATGVRVALNP